MKTRSRLTLYPFIVMIALVLSFAVACTDAAITGPKQVERNLTQVSQTLGAQMASLVAQRDQTQVVSVVNDSHWETRRIDWFADCGGKNLSGYFQLHLSTHQKTYSDGSTAMKQYGNSAAAHFSDVDDNKYVFHLLLKDGQELGPGAEFELFDGERYQMISRGPSGNDYFSFYFRVAFDGTTVNFIFEQEVSCKGMPNP